MVRSQLEIILNDLGAMQPRPGTFTLAAGRTVTLHLAWGGTSFQIDKVKAVRLEGDVLFAENGSQTLGASVEAVGVVTRD